MPTEKQLIEVGMGDVLQAIKTRHGTLIGWALCKTRMVLPFCPSVICNLCIRMIFPAKFAILTSELFPKS